MDTSCKTFPRCPSVVELGPPAKQSTPRHIHVKLLQSLQKYRQTIGGKTQKGDPGWSYCFQGLRLSCLCILAFRCSSCSLWMKCFCMYLRVLACCSLCSFWLLSWFWKWSHQFISGREKPPLVFEHVKIQPWKTFFFFLSGPGVH